MLTQESCWPRQHARGSGAGIRPVCQPKHLLLALSSCLQGAFELSPVLNHKCELEASNQFGTLQGKPPLLPPVSVPELQIHHCQHSACDFFSFISSSYCESLSSLHFSCRSYPWLPGNQTLPTSLYIHEQSPRKCSLLLFPKEKVVLPVQSAIRCIPATDQKPLSSPASVKILIVNHRCNFYHQPATPVIHNLNWHS